MLPGHISPDGLWAWDGSAWVSTLSPDGCWRWDGFRWVPQPPAGAVAGDLVADRGATTRALLLAGCVVAAIGVLAIAAIAASGRHDALSASGASPAQPTGASAPGYPGAPRGTRVYAVASRNHVAGRVAYAQTPPVGGEHAAVWLNCGIYDRAVPNENAVHSLEHGVVWVTYDADRLDAAEVATLRQVVSDHYDGTAQRYVILSPFTGLPSPVVASAWGVQLRITSVSDPRLPQFIDYFRQGPETPEMAGVCSGGVGRSLDAPGASGPVTLLPRRARSVPA